MRTATMSKESTEFSNKKLINVESVELFRQVDMDGESIEDDNQVIPRTVRNE